MRGDLGERIARRVWRIGQRGVHCRIAVRQSGPRAANRRLREAGRRRRHSAPGRRSRRRARSDRARQQLRQRRRVVQRRAARRRTEVYIGSFLDGPVPPRPCRGRHRWFARHRSRHCGAPDRTRGGRRNCLSRARGRRARVRSGDAIGRRARMGREVRRCRREKRDGLFRADRLPSSVPSIFW